MLELRTQVALIDSSKNRDEVEKTASLIELLDHTAVVLSDPRDLAQIDGGAGELAAVIVRDRPDFELLHRTLPLLGNTTTPPACFLQDMDSSLRTVPPAMVGQVLDILPASIGYRELLTALHDARVYADLSVPQRSEYSSRLARSLVGVSREIEYVRKLILQVAATEASVLVLGESGTGKEVVARNIHHHSARRGHAFVPVNCGAIPAELLESELFGHERGAFTGAYSSRQGRFEMAEGGTLFLDEIGDMPLSMQVKLLRVLQEHCYERVGSNITLQTNVRIIAATHQNLEQLVAEGKFRMDLYYRLNVFPIELPPLRTRIDDIPLLMKVFINRMEREKRGTVRLNASAQAALTKYFWPGNVRELSNLIERLAILYPQQLVSWSDLPDKFRPNQDWVAEQHEGSRGTSTPMPPSQLEPAVPSAMHLPEEGLDLRGHVARIECSLITQALEQCDWVVARSAKLLNLQRTTLVEKMKKYKIYRPEELTEF